ncbi:MAG: hypothetical protein XD50_1539 [Clostridia bacterium 41_269]|nr:MAG: hypothetical protein XD50_1539 [Clostridia bacterium 41_269]
MATIKSTTTARSFKHLSVYERGTTTQLRSDLST